jgi:hypothetical protein
MLRGNHEDMGRAGVGWRLLLSPFAGVVEDPIPDDGRPYSLRFMNLTLAILDVANAASKYSGDPRKEKYGRWMERLERDLPPDRTRPTWLLLHNPLWVSYGCADNPCKESVQPTNALNAFRDHLRGEPPTKFDLVFGGDTHMFQFFVPKDRKIPPQIVAGMSGDLLAEEAKYDRKALDKAVDGPLFDVAGKLWMHHGFGYLVLTKEPSGWSAALFDPDRKDAVVTCKLDSAALDGAQDKFPCE